MPRVPMFVVAIALANFLVPLNSTAIVAALPTIARELAVDRTTSAWLVTAYLIAMAALQPVGGRIGDRFGRRRVLITALVAFALASAAVPLARDFTSLVAFRLLQSVCAAAITPNAMGLLRGEAVEGRSGTYFGIVGMTSGIGASAGPLLGGIFAAIDWRWLFVMNVPLVIAILALGWGRIPRSAAHRTAPPDVVGAVSLAVLLAVPAWILTGLEPGITPPTVGLLVAMPLGFIAFVRYEKRHPDPALPPALFASRAFSAANVTIALSNLALYGTFIAIPIALANEPDGSIRTGVILTAMSLGSIVLSPVSGALVDRFGARLPISIGGMLMAVGFVTPVALGRVADVTWLGVFMAVAGAGISMNFPATRIAALDAAPARFAGVASGVTSTSRYFGGIAGSVAAGLVLGRSGDLGALPGLFTAFGVAGIAAALVGLAFLHPIRGGIDVRRNELGAAK